MWNFFKRKKEEKDDVDMKPKRVIILPKEILDELKVEDGETARLKIDKEDLLIDFREKNGMDQDILIQWFLFPSLVASFIFFMFFMNTNQVSMTGSKSISSMTFLLGIGSGIASFIYFFIQGKKEKIKTASRDIHWRNFPTVLVAFVVVLGFILMLFFKLMDLLFAGASFDLFTATLLFFIFMNIINYQMIQVSFTISPSKLTTILIVIIIGGVSAAMITNNDQQWWQHNFSFLGTPEASNSWEFNVTLILSSLLMIALIDYLFVTIQKSMPLDKNLKILRVILVLIALNLGGVGFFPYTDNVLYQKIHNSVALALVVLVIIAIIGLRWFLPKVSKEFLKLSYLIALALVASIFLFLVIGYLSLTVFELVAFILAFSWLLLLLQNLQKLASSIDSSFEVIVQADTQIK